MGFNGNIDTGVTAGHYVRYNASTNMNYKTGKVNFFVNYGYNGGDNLNFGFVERPGVNLQDFRFVNNNQSHLLKFGADIYLNDKKMNVPSLQVKKGDKFTAKNKDQSKKLIKQCVDENDARVVPDWVSVDRDGLSGEVIRMPEREEVPTTALSFNFNIEPC